VVDAAEKHDVNLLCFPGGGLRISEGFEDQRNVIYDLVDAARLDGLVTWASTVGGSLGPAQVMDFHQRYQPLPMVSLAQVMQGVPTLSVDSYQGMRAAIVHLIEQHGYRRLAFIRGPASHVYAQERYRAYTDVLQEYGIPFAPDLVTRPVHWEAGAEAIQMILDESKQRPGVDFQAVVAVSDLLALGAMRALQARGIQVPRDVAVVGFNDSMEGRLVTPPLTSVSLPFYEQGQQAVEMVCRQLAGDTLPAQAMLQSRLVVRQSCGCSSEAVVQAAAGSIQARSERFEAGSTAIRNEFLVEAAQMDVSSNDPAAWATRLLDAFQADLGDPAHGRFLHTLQIMLDRAVAIGGDDTAWQATISALRRCALPYLNHQERSQAEDLFGQARVVIGEAAQRAQGYRQLQAERQSDALREIGQALITTFDVDKLTDVLAEKLPELGIVSCYLALYEDPSSSLEQARLVLAYTEQGRVPLESGGHRFPSRRLTPEGLLPRHRRCSLVVEPLFFREEQIGFVLFEIGPRDGTVYEVLRAHISSALKGALLFHEAQQARLVAEKADQIKTRLLANVSHELRTPLNIILDTTKNALHSSRPDEATRPPALLNDFQHIQNSAEHQLRVINDLLDLSRAEIDELDLYLELLDPRQLLEEAFHSIANLAATQRDVVWRLQLPERLPWINADAVRLRQILLNLLSNANKFTERGYISLGAEVSPPYLHMWIEDTGLGIPPDQQERIFEPFVTAEHDSDRHIGGIGLGLSITRHLVALHAGRIELDSQPGKGSTFHVYLPLPRLSDHSVRAPEQVQSVLLLISTASRPAAEIIDFSLRQALEIRRLQAGDDLETVLTGVQPAAVAWDLVGANPGDWAIVRRLRNHPRLSQSPFILYGQIQQNDEGQATLAAGMTSFVVKSAGGQALLDAIDASRPAEPTGPILIVDDDPKARSFHQELVTIGLPGHVVRTAVDGAAALTLMAEEVPSLVILDLMMPGMSGAEVLDWMRADPRLRHVPVVILSSKLLNLDDVKQLERHARVTLQSKGILSEAETIAALNRALFGGDSLPPHTSAVVKRAVAHLHQNYTRPLSRWEIAEAIGVSEDYLSRVFSRELGLSPWDYLNRYRVNRAKELLCRTDANIRTVAHQVGFRDQAYFSRVFRKLTGKSPNAFRENPEA
jgi:signal transduction histidine kinase/DNA-binding LacI/PurR family transcriptional regulator/AraC-like DNA-binding protein